jgi:hypothetical protein
VSSFVESKQFLGASEAIAPLVESSQERRGGRGGEEEDDDTCFDKFFGTLINELF